MIEQTGMKPAETDEQPMACHTWKRRGLIAAAWAAVAAIVARQTTEPVQAGTDGDVVLGAANAETAPTTIANTTAASIALVLQATAMPAGRGLYALGSQAGVIGFQVGSQAFVPGNAGVFGHAEAVNTPGVMGQHNTGTGVLGEAAGIGVSGVSAGVGVYGVIVPGSGNTIAVYGYNGSDDPGPSAGAGGFGVYGLSAKGHGVVGAATTTGAAAVVGSVNGLAGAYAGGFFGPVVVQGDFTVVGGAKSAAVPHPDGTHRRLYCVESPESWFEDFGEGTLACGQAEVRLDPDFAAVVDLAKYHVFLTQYDAHNDLCVTERSANRFLVKAKDDTSSGAFSWRVVAKRKDIPAPRFETVTVPSEPVLPSLPEAPVAPAPRDSGRR
jgi:hypothetical protein